MKIGILPYEKEKNFTGANRVIRGIVNEIQEINKRDKMYLLSQSDWLGLGIDCIPVFGNSFGTTPLTYAAQVWELDLIHSYYYPFSISGNSNCAGVITVHDVTPLKDWQHYKAGNLTRKFFEEHLGLCIAKADRVIADSEYTKQGIVDLYHINDAKISVIYCAIDRTHRLDTCMSDHEMPAPFPFPYVLAVSSIQPTKNYCGMIKAFMELKRKNRDCEDRLVIAGKCSDMSLLRELKELCGNEDKDVIFLGYVTDDQLRRLYMYAKAFINTSFFEGFGIPVLEALDAGRAVICSQEASLPEVGGQAVCYCDPYDIESIENAMEAVLLDDPYRASLEGKAKIQAGKFSYERSAKETIKIYRELVG